MLCLNLTSNESDIDLGFLHVSVGLYILPGFELEHFLGCQLAVRRTVY